MTAAAASSSQRRWAIRVNRWAYLFSRRWMLVFSVFYGLYVALPWLAPVLMKWGWETPARWIYQAYALVCHQLPQRSFFLFGPKTMYSLPEIQAAWKATYDPLVLRQFIGNETMGWKVAWSDRMVSMYTSVLLFAWVWWPLRRKLRPLPPWAFVALLTPLALDGTTHLLSDMLSGVGRGFRYDNTWLAELTNFAFPAAFYVGDALGSFNSWMRLISGVLFGLGVVGWIFPMVDEAFEDYTALIRRKFARVAQ